MKLATLLLASISTLTPLCSAEEKPDVLRTDNLVAWCIVPFDAKKRGPDERAQMLERLGFKQVRLRLARRARADVR